MKKDKSKTQITIMHFISIFLIISMILVFSLTMMDINYFVLKYGSLEASDFNEDINSIDIDDVDMMKNALIIESGMTTVSMQIIEESMQSLRMPIRKVLSVETLDMNTLDDVGVVFLSGEYLLTSVQNDYFYDLINQGTDIVLTTLPDENALSDEGIRQRLGILNIKNMDVTTEARFLEGFMLGGLLEVEYEPYNYRLVELTSTTKIYADDNDKSPLVWRNSTGESRIFVINGPFFNSMVGYGIVSAIMSEINTDFVYPVVNALTYTYRGMPYLSNENVLSMKDIYNRDSLLLQHDILIPDVLGLNKSRTMSPSSIITTSFRSTDPVVIGGDIANSLYNYEKDIHKLLGILAYELTGDREMDIIYLKMLSNYTDIVSLYDHEHLIPDDYLSVNEEITDTINGIIRPWKIGENNFRVVNSGMVNIPITYSEIQEHQENELELYALMTAFGAITHHFDFERVIYPESDQDSWITVFKHYGDFINEYGELFADFDKSNTQQTSEKIASYVLSNPIIKYFESEIELLVNNWQGEMSFILRTNKGVKSVKNGYFTEIEEHVYLITIQQPTSIIKLETINLK